MSYQRRLKKSRRKMNPLRNLRKSSKFMLSVPCLLNSLKRKRRFLNFNQMWNKKIMKLKSSKIKTKAFNFKIMKSIKLKLMSLINNYQNFRWSLKRKKRKYKIIKIKIMQESKVKLFSWKKLKWRKHSTKIYLKISYNKQKISKFKDIFSKKRWKS